MIRLSTSLDIVSKALLGLVTLTVFSSYGIIVRHDVGQSEYETRGTEFPSIFFLERQGSRKVCVATLIHPQWALTAAHCAEETMLDATVEAGRRFGVRLAGENREIDQVIKHPQYQPGAADDVDLALLRFRTPSAFPRPVPLNFGTDEFDQIVTIVGWGYFGVGTLGRQYDDGRMRHATNRISRADRYLRFVFDDPRDQSAESLPTEGTLGLGDSGGPALMATNSGQRLVGIAVGQITGPNYEEETQGRYGAVAIYERLSSHIEWIETVIGSKAPFDS